MVVVFSNDIWLKILFELERSKKNAKIIRDRNENVWLKMLKCGVWVVRANKYEKDQYPVVYVAANRKIIKAVR